MPKVTEAISRFLAAKAANHPGRDLLERYLSCGGPACLETQMNVAAGDGEVPTANHTEHAALARCVLGMMSSEAGFDFASQVDCCGGTARDK